MTKNFHVSVSDWCLVLLFLVWVALLMAGILVQRTKFTSGGPNILLHQNHVICCWEYWLSGVLLVILIFFLVFLLCNVCMIQMYLVCDLSYIELSWLLLNKDYEKIQILLDDEWLSISGCAQGWEKNSSEVRCAPKLWVENYYSTHSCRDEGVRGWLLLTFGM